MGIILNCFMLSLIAFPMAVEAAANPFVIPAKQVDEMLRTRGIEIEQFLVELIPVARSFARPPVSNYQVGAAALGKSGNVYLGVNLEFLDLPLNETIHGEQFLIVNARNQGETGIVAMALSAAPCGHCRQFLNEIGENLNILTPNAPPRVLSSLLPEAFGPKDLGVIGNLFDQPNACPLFPHEKPLVEKAMQAAYASYAPYSHSKSGVAIRTRGGKIYSGSYLENAAFNPSLSPLQAALVALVADLGNYEEISEVVLVEKIGAKSSHEVSTKALLKCIAPNAHFKLENRGF